MPCFLFAKLSTDRSSWLRLSLRNHRVQPASPEENNRNFFLAVGSKANIGGAASAPVIAAAFHPSLAPVGVLLAVLGYVLGTYGAWLCGLAMMRVAA